MFLSCGLIFVTTADSSDLSTRVIPSKMVTGSQNGIFKPKIYVATTSKEPVSVESTLRQENWKQTMITKFEALQRNKTWTLVSLPKEVMP